MPSEKIATTTRHGDNVETLILKVQWGAKGGCPEAPDGWVNAGYAHLNIGTAEDPFRAGVELDEEEIDHLIRVLKRVRRQAFRAGRDCVPPMMQPAIQVNWPESADLLATVVDELNKKERLRGRLS